MLNTILFSGLHNLSDVSVGYFTIYTHTVRLIALYAKVSTVEGQGNPDGSTSLGIGVNPVDSTKDSNLKMSHNEIWDDSALVDSWNEALEEYKVCHCCHVRGTDIDLL